MRIWVGVIPGADAVRAELELPEVEAGLELELDEHAAAASAATVTMVAACQWRRRALFMRC
jgi:hypothetical protein